MPFKVCFLLYCKVLYAVLSAETRFPNQFILCNLLLLTISLPITLGELGSHEGLCGASPHSDFGMITLLLTNGVPGLQVLNFPLYNFLF